MTSHCTPRFLIFSQWEFWALRQYQGKKINPSLRINWCLWSAKKKLTLMFSLVDSQSAPLTALPPIWHWDPASGSLWQWSKFQSLRNWLLAPQCLYSLCRSTMLLLSCKVSNKCVGKRGYHACGWNKEINQAETAVCGLLHVSQQGATGVAEWIFQKLGREGM